MDKENEGILKGLIMNDNTVQEKTLTYFFLQLLLFSPTPLFIFVFSINASFHPSPPPLISLTLPHQSLPPLPHHQKSLLTYFLYIYPLLTASYLYYLSPQPTPHLYHQHLFFSSSFLPANLLFPLLPPSQTCQPTYQPLSHYKLPSG